MNYTKTKPYKDLEPHIHFYWELKGSDTKTQRERVFPDGCAGVLINLGSPCLTDNGSRYVEFGKTYVVGAMTSFKESVIDVNTHLIGVCLKPANFTNFYSYSAQDKLINETVELEANVSFDIDKTISHRSNYFNQFFLRRRRNKANELDAILKDIHASNGLASIQELAKRNFSTVRQLERKFNNLIGLSPKQYVNIIRFQKALHLIKTSNQKNNLLNIALECGFYDHAHLTKEVNRNTGLSPSQL